nr:uncharacterized protein LOC113814620 isoform X1 [Penaeus vannamei]
MADRDRIDDILSAVGYGRWQIPILMATIVANTIPLHYMASSLLNAPMSFRCFAPGSSNSSNSSFSELDSLDNAWFNNECLDPQDNAHLADSAHLAHLAHPALNPVGPPNRRATGLPACPEIEYDSSVYSLTVISEHGSQEGHADRVSAGSAFVPGRGVCPVVPRRAGAEVRHGDLGEDGHAVHHQPRFVKESPRWLVQSGSGREAAAELAEAARKNRVELPSHLASYLEKMKEDTCGLSGGEKEKVALKQLFAASFSSYGEYLRSPAMLIIIFITPLMYFLMCLLYYGIILNVNNFTSTNPFQYIAMLSVFEIVSVLLARP